MFFSSFKNFGDAPGKLLIACRDEGGAESCDTGLQKSLTGCDQVIATKIRMVEVDAGKSVYLKVDEPGGNLQIII